MQHQWQEFVQAEEVKRFWDRAASGEFAKKPVVSTTRPIQDQKDLTAAFKMSRQLVSHFFAVCSIQVAVQLADKNPPVPVAHPIRNRLVINPRHHAMGNEIVPEPLECDPIKPK
jgi:hypothetical protein